MDVITNLVAKGNSFLWSFLLIVLLCGTGIYYTIRLRFIQVRKFGEGWKLVFGHLSLNGEKHEKGEMTRVHSRAGRRHGSYLLDVGKCVLWYVNHLRRGNSGPEF